MKKIKVPSCNKCDWKNKHLHNACHRPITDVNYIQPDCPLDDDAPVQPTFEEELMNRYEGLFVDYFVRTQFMVDDHSKAYRAIEWLKQQLLNPKS